MDTRDSRSISQKVIETIQDKILSGELKKGDRLPTERQLTEDLNVSRPALREALKALEIIGLIDKKQGSGNYISAGVGGNYFKPLSLAFRLGDGPVADVLNLRRVLEEYSIREACGKAASRDLADLEKVSSEMVKTEDPGKKAKLDQEFHYEIARIANNVLVLEILESISYLLIALFTKTVYYSFYEEASINEIYQEHASLIELIRRGRPDEAAEAMRVHLSKINPDTL